MFQKHKNQTDQNALEYRDQVTLSWHLTRRIFFLSFILSHVKYLNTMMVPIDVASHNTTIKNIADNRDEDSVFTPPGSRWQ